MDGVTNVHTDLQAYSIYTTTLTFLTSQGYLKGPRQTSNHTAFPWYYPTRVHKVTTLNIL